MLKKYITTLSAACLLTVGMANTAYSFNLSGVFNGSISPVGNANAEIVEPDDVKITNFSGEDIIDHNGDQKVKFNLWLRNDSNETIIGIEAIDCKNGSRIKRVPINARLPKALRPNQEKQITIQFSGTLQVYGYPERIIPIYAE